MCFRFSINFGAWVIYLFDALRSACRAAAVRRIVRLVVAALAEGYIRIVY